eukprot:6214691-Pleurochrysis_carterae.AAC.3
MCASLYKEVKKRGAHQSQAPSAVAEEQSESLRTEVQCNPWGWVSSDAAVADSATPSLDKDQSHARGGILAKLPWRVFLICDLTDTLPQTV